jgi:hypothetical protein
LIRVAVLSLAACYAPDTRDCTIACGAPTDCAHGQQCGADGFCAAPDVSCSGDAGTPVALHVQIMGHGRVTIDPSLVCDSDSTTHGDCTFSVPANVARELAAITTKDDHAFLGWSFACAGQDATCTLVPVSAMTQVGARFQ